MTHDALIEAAAAWLRKKGCSVVITDMSHGGQETPDAIGWHGTGSIIVECKASLSDFRADSKKSFRRDPERGMGGQRYFCTPLGLISVDALPPKWGLIEWSGRRMSIAKKHEGFLVNSARSEISLLLSAIRRIGHTAPIGVSVKCYTIESKNRATIGIKPPKPTNP